jgi:hypothetical protein
MVARTWPQGCLQSNSYRKQSLLQGRVGGGWRGSSFSTSWTRGAAAAVPRGNNVAGSPRCWHADPGEPQACLLGSKYCFPRLLRLSLC